MQRNSESCENDYSNFIFGRYLKAVVQLTFCVQTWIMNLHIYHFLFFRYTTSGVIRIPVLRLNGIPYMAMDGPWQFHPWPGLVHGWTRDGNRHFYPWPGMDHPWPGLETISPESSKQLTEAPFSEILSRL